MEYIFNRASCLRNIKERVGEAIKEFEAYLEKAPKDARRTPDAYYGTVHRSHLRMHNCPPSVKNFTCLKLDSRNRIGSVLLYVWPLIRRDHESRCGISERRRG